MYIVPNGGVELISQQTCVHSTRI